MPLGGTFSQGPVGCISFLGCWSNHRLHGFKQRKLFVHSAGDQTSDIRAQGQRHGVGGTTGPQKLPGASCSLPLPALVAAGIPWFVVTSLGCLPLRSHCLPFCMCHVSPSPRYRTVVIVFRAHLDSLGCSHLKTLNVIVSAKSVFAIQGNICRFQQ